MEPSVTVRLRGGLGNQLFQYFAGRLVATASDLPLHLDTSEVSLTHDAVGVRALSHGATEVRIWRPTSGHVPAMDLRWIERRWGMSRGLSYLTTVREVLEATEADRAKRLVVDGFFSSRLIADEVRARGMDLSIELRKPSTWFRSMEEAASETRPVMVHLRRGDYRSHPHWGLLDASYYRAALSALGSLGSGAVWVFSDEPEAAREVMSFMNPSHLVVIEAPEDSPAAESLLLMASGSALVAANSTMSWWAGQLTEAPTAVPVPFHPSDPTAETLTGPWYRTAKRNWMQIPAVWS
jgi:hypothetical protein